MHLAIFIFLYAAGSGSANLHLQLYPCKIDNEETELFVAVLFKN